MEHVDSNQSVGDGNSSVGDASSKDQISRDAYEKLLSQRKKDQEKLKELESFRQEILTKKQEEELKLAEEKGEFRKILEQRERELNETKSKLTDYERTFTNSVKLNAVLNKLPGRLLKNEYSSFIELDAVAIDPESGEVDTRTVEEVANKFIKEHSFLLKAKGNNQLPNDNASPTKTLTYEEWTKLPLKEMKEKRKFVK
jgi:hypothetical protein